MISIIIILLTEHSSITQQYSICRQDTCTSSWYQVSSRRYVWVLRG